MEEGSIERAAPTPQLLNLIRDEVKWKVGEAGDDGGRSRNTISDAEEDRKLELKLGLPDVQGEERTAHPGDEIEQHEESYTALSLGCFPTTSKQSTNTATTGAKRGFYATVDAKPQVVGWPPVRSFRRNLTNGSTSKQSPERQQNDEAAVKEKLDSKRSSLVKINMDGIPIGRKINLAAYDSFQKLSSAVDMLFRGFLKAQKDLGCCEGEGQGAEKRIFSGLLDGTGEYTLIYEDNGGGRTLARDIPWR
ncbi:hypothetical protein PR202_gb01867 [Eleusine coracana subsp. coracana]|uniref:Auxin-responsive protein n=1 Tax=Eleusine coracana subsp. coracana TaxID=191504 RepID=A0AAV5DV90_ELECO|nr:hypothetical protein PR202_gb01867 [Eleusine coracana subsp. coracana]